MSQTKNNFGCSCIILSVSCVVIDATYPIDTPIIGPNPAPSSLCRRYILLSTHKVPLEKPKRLVPNKKTKRNKTKRLQIQNFNKREREREREGIMETITHRSVEVNGIKMHVAEKGEGTAGVVLMLHGFPELWYSWRHQILGLASRGYRAVAPDLRGYGDTEGPAAVDDYSIFHIVGDVVALIDHLVGQDVQVFVVGHDWGAIVAWHLCMFRPDRVKALVNLSVAFRPRSPAVTPVQYFKSIYGDDYYVCKFQEPGVAEAVFARYDTGFIHRKFLTSRYSGRPFLMREDVGFGSQKDQAALPSWLTEEDVGYFASKFEKTGFTNPINYYRNLELNWKLTAPWAGTQIKVPTKFIVGDEDLTYHYPGIQDYIHGGGLKKHVPFLDEVVVMPGVSHWINQEKAGEVTEHILSFIQNF